MSESAKNSLLTQRLGTRYLRERNGGKNCLKIEIDSKGGTRSVRWSRKKRKREKEGEQEGGGDGA